MRRRAALAVGRVGLRDGVQPLVTLLRADADPEVRQIAAFALGLIGDKSARDPLETALTDSSALVQGSAAEALGLIGDPATADSIGRMVAQIVQSGALAQPPADDDARRDTAAAAARLGIYALVRLKAYGPLAAAVLEPSGQPRVRWWPIAFALQRLEDKRGFDALMTLAKDTNPYTRAFAVKGLGALKDRAAMPVLQTLLAGGDRPVLIETIRAMGQIGDPAAAPPLLKMLQAADTPAPVRLELVSALGGIHAPGVMDTLLDLLPDPNAALRAAALRSTAAQDPESFVTILSGLDADPDWHVRAALASVLATLAPEIGLPRLTAMLDDTDQRVIPAVLAALVKLGAPDAAAVMLDRLKADDPAVRAAAARAIGELKPPNAPQALAAAYRFGVRDSTYIARAAALEALAKYGVSAMAAVLPVQEVVADKDWAVRVRAAALLAVPGAGNMQATIRPAPTQLSPETYQAPRLVNPPVSTQVFIDTDRGAIQIELAVLDAPLTTENFVTLARKGFFNGLTIHRVVPNFVMQDGDSRGDGEGGPGYTIRDELNERPYLRGTVGMALDWADTGGSQFFITHSPQPHLDAKYTAFGRVSGGMEVVDQIQQGDVVRRVRVWDGDRMTTARD